MSYRVETATIEHAKAMAPFLRREDADEMWAQGGWCPEDALIFSIEHSTESHVVILEATDEPVMMFGLGRPLSPFDQRRSIWLLGTDRADVLKRDLVKTSANFMRLMAAGHRVYNYVLPSNRSSLIWLRWLGFNIYEARPYGWLHKPFHYVEKVVEPCVPSPPLH